MQVGIDSFAAAFDENSRAVHPLSAARIVSLLGRAVESDVAFGHAARQ